MGIETLVAVSLASTAVGGISSAAGSLAQGQAQKQAAYYQAQVAANNAAASDKYAQRLTQQGGEAVKEQGQKVGRMIGSQRAALAAAGVDVNEGTAVDLQANSAEMGRLDELRIYGDAMEKVYGAKMQGVNYRNEANLDIMKGKNAEKAGQMNAFTSLVNTAGSFSSKWAGFSRTGAVPSFGD